MQGPLYNGMLPDASPRESESNHLQPSIAELRQRREYDNEMEQFERTGRGGDDDDYAGTRALRDLTATISDSKPFADDHTGSETRERLEKLYKHFNAAANKGAGDPANDSNPVVRDAVPGAAPTFVPGQVDFVPLAAVSGQQMAANADHYNKVINEIFDSSCDELEQEALREIARRNGDDVSSTGNRTKKHRKRRRRQARREAAMRAAKRRNAGERLSSITVGSVASASLSYNRTGGTQLFDDHYYDDDDDDDDDEEDDEYKRASESESSSMFSDPSNGDKQEAEKPKQTSGSSRALQSQLNCFLCRFGHREYETVNVDAIAQLRTMLESGVGHRNIFAHAKMIHKMYMRTIYSPAQVRGEQLPVWRTRQILEHIYSHDRDPRLFLYLTLENLSVVEGELRNMIFMRDENGKNAMHEKHYKDWQNTLKMMCLLYKADPSSMNFFNESAQIDLAAANKRMEGLRLKPRNVSFVKK